jgi:hypothetical protein
MTGVNVDQRRRNSAASAGSSRRPSAAIAADCSGPGWPLPTSDHSAAVVPLVEAEWPSSSIACIRTDGAADGFRTTAAASSRIGCSVA